MWAWISEKNILYNRKRCKKKNYDRKIWWGVVRQACLIWFRLKRVLSVWIPDRKLSREPTYVPLIMSAVDGCEWEVDPLASKPVGSREKVNWLIARDSTIWGSPENWDSKSFGLLSFRGETDRCGTLSGVFFNFTVGFSSEGGRATCLEYFALPQIKNPV